MTATGDYAKQIHISATPEQVFDTLTDAAEFATWWAPASGSAAEAGELRITFDGIEDPLILRVGQATHPTTVIWDVTSCAFLPTGQVPHPPSPSPPPAREDATCASGTKA